MSMKAAVPGTQLELEADPVDGTINLWGPCERPPGSCIIDTFTALGCEQLIAMLTRAKNIVETGVGEMAKDA